MDLHIADTLAFLLGDWALERTLTDHRAGADGRFEGTARLRPFGGREAAGRRARYEERGRLRYRDLQTSASRTLDYRATGAGAVAVSFADGRPFFELDLRTGTCRATHPCGDDVYELEFELVGDALLRERWRVTGPAKDYEATTTWRRLNPA